MADTVTMPKMGFDMAEGTLVRWVKGRGENISKGDIIAEIETDKATVEVESPYGGIVYKHLVDQGAVVPVGDAIAIIAAPGEEVKEGALPEAGGSLEKGKEEKAKLPDQEEHLESVQQPQSGETAEGRIMASPLAKRMAHEKGVDLAEIRGSGPEGRVVVKDVEAFASTQQISKPAEIKPLEPETGPQTVSVSSPIQFTAKEDQDVPLDRLRTTIGRRMTESKQQIPHIYLTREYKMDALMQLRKQLNQLLPEDQKLTVNVFVVKAAALALRKFPNLNASLNGNKITRHGQINVGVAVAVEGGLMTVVCRNTDLKPLSSISIEIREKAARARARKVRPDDVEGSTFSISNLGMYHIENFSAIINPPEVAILAVGSAQQVPVVEDGELKAGWRMKVTLSSDHRVSDGAESAQYLEEIGLFLEEPLRLVV